MTQQEYDDLILKEAKYKKLLKIFWILFGSFMGCVFVISFAVGFVAGYDLAYHGGSLGSAFDAVQDVYNDYPILKIANYIFEILAHGCLIPAIVFTVLRATTAKKLKYVNKSDNQSTNLPY